MNILFICTLCLCFVSSAYSGSKKPASARTKGGVQLQSADGAFKAKIGGRIMVDAALYADDRSDYPNSTEIRRTRIHIKGKVYKDWKFKSQIEFSDGEVDLKSMWLGYYGFNGLYINVGQFMHPFGLESQTSSKYTTFMERSLMNTFPKVHLYGVGLLMGMNGTNWSLGAAVYGEESNSEGDGADEEWGVSVRGTVAPVLRESMLVHFGSSFSYLNPDSADQTVQFKSAPESHLAPKTVDTGNIPTDNMMRYGVEIASVIGPFSAQGEYTAAVVDMTDLGTAVLDGFYLQTSWFITGETKPYDVEDGTFGRVKPEENFGDEGTGAVEIAMRYSRLNLNDISMGITGGEERNITLGVNWYLNPTMHQYQLG